MLLCFLAEVTRVVGQSDTDEGGGGVLQNESDTLGAPHIKVTHTPDNMSLLQFKSDTPQYEVTHTTLAQPTLSPHESPHACHIIGAGFTWLAEWLFCGCLRGGEWVGE